MSMTYHPKKVGEHDLTISDKLSDDGILQASGTSAGASGSGAFDEARFRQVLGYFATGVTVVTATEEGMPVGFTCQSFTSLSLDPPMVAIAPAKSSTSWPRIAKSGAFCVNILNDAQQQLSQRFAVTGGDKFTGVAWHVGEAGAPVLEGVLGWVECELEAIYDAGDHELVVGRVLSLGVGDGSPLIFYRSGFTKLAVQESPPGRPNPGSSGAWGPSPVPGCAGKPAWAPGEGGD